MCWLNYFAFGVNTSHIYLFTYTKLLKCKTVLGKLAGLIGALRGPDVARGPDFQDRCCNASGILNLSKHVAQLINRGSVAHLLYNFSNATTVARAQRRNKNC